jgi:hypothetical protein
VAFATTNSVASAPANRAHTTPNRGTSFDGEIGPRYESLDWSKAHTEPHHYVMRDSFTKKFLLVNTRKSRHSAHASLNQ